MYKFFTCISIIIALSSSVGCSAVWKVRDFADTVVKIQNELGLEALKQADIERQRLRAARCYSPALTPAALSAAAQDADLGDAWVAELLQDCPQFSVFLSNLVMARAESAGLKLH